MQRYFDEAISAGVIPPLIAVTPASLDEGFSWYVDHPGCPIESAFIADFIPAFEGIYGGSRTKETRWIGGSSMGAYGALRYVLKHPALFSRIIMVAPAVWDSIANRSISDQHPPHGVFRAFLSGGKVDDALWQNNLYPRLMEGYLKQKSPVIFYTSAGDRDSMGLEFYAAKLHRFLREQHQCTTLRIWDGDHGDWDYYPLALIDGIAHTTKKHPQECP